MSAKIRVLPDHLINQIAAGEVVENAASATKELVENSLDAGAKRIVVSLENGGYDLLSVADDGSGMSTDDACLCFERHATSKLKVVEDLGKLATLGFRGEALAALAAVSKVTLTTATLKSQDKGTRVEIVTGRLLSALPCGRSQGTTIEVRNLFYNIAARRKFQPSQQRSERDILRLLTAFALGYPNIEFLLRSEGVQKWYAKPFEDPWKAAVKKRLQDLLGDEALAFDRPIQKEKMGYSIDGFVSAPGQHRPQRTGQYLFVQGRYVFSSFVSRCVREAFSTRLPEDRHPLFVLFLQFPPGDVDVNVHPQKKEVRFCNEAFLYPFIQEAVQASFLKGEYTPSRSPLPFSISSDRTTTLPWESQPLVSNVEEVVVEQQIEIPKDPSELDVIGLFDKYLFVTAASLPESCPLFIQKKQEGLVLIDLSLAKMRIAFEEIIQRERNGSIAVQRFLIPRKMQLSRSETYLLQKQLGLLREIGLEMQILGEREILIEGLPPFLQQDDVERVMIACLEESIRDSPQQNFIYRLALRTTAFVRWYSGSLLEAKSLTKKLLVSKEPYFSPRGKSIMAHLESSDLEKFFKVTPKNVYAFS